MTYGSMPIDNGWLILEPEQHTDLLAKEPEAAPYIQAYMGGNEFLNGYKRYCLWLVDCPPQVLRNLKNVGKRVEENQRYRLSSNREATRKLAKMPSLFGEIRQPVHNYLLIPKVSSENREFMPIGFCTPEIIASGSALIIPNATPYHFGILQSTMHNAWMRAVCGRMKSDYQYSASIVYNNFPWPIPTDKQLTTIESAAQSVLDARTQFPDATLADLYGPLTMPPVLLKAHAALDKAVDAAYGYKGTNTDAGRVAFLFELYEGLIAKQ
jgi:hypothetical protein